MIIKNIFSKLDKIKNQHDRVIFLLDCLPNSEKIHVEKFILSRIEKYYAEQAMRDSLNVTD